MTALLTEARIEERPRVELPDRPESPNESAKWFSKKLGRSGILILAQEDVPFDRGLCRGRMVESTDDETDAQVITVKNNSANSLTRIRGSGSCKAYVVWVRKMHENKWGPFTDEENSKYDREQREDLSVAALYLLESLPVQSNPPL